MIEDGPYVVFIYLSFFFYKYIGIRFETKNTSLNFRMYIVTEKKGYNQFEMLPYLVFFFFSLLYKRTKSWNLTGGCKKKRKEKKDNIKTGTFLIVCCCFFFHTYMIGYRIKKKKIL